MKCERCTRPARHRMTVGEDRLTDVCCVHADQVMTEARKLVPAAEGDRGWLMWQDAHAEMCGGSQ